MIIKPRPLRPLLFCGFVQDDARFTAAVSMNDLLLRGCTLKNSGYVMGLVVYTGRETRIQMNSSEPPRKQGATPHR